MAKIINYSVIIVFILSCTTFNERFGSGIGEKSIEKIREINGIIIDYRIDNNTLELTKALKMIEDLKPEAANNRYFQALLTGLESEILFYQGRVVESKGMIEEIIEKDKNEMHIFILQALHAPGVDESIALLEEGVEKSVKTDKILLYLGDYYFMKSDFKKSVDLYDSVILQTLKREDDTDSLFFQESILKYESKRDFAFMMRDEDVKSAETLKILQKKIFIISDMLEMTLNEIENPAVLNELDINDVNFFGDMNVTKLDRVKRKTVAFFLIRVLSAVENDLSIITKYDVDLRKAYDEEEVKSLSPVDDISPLDPFYSAALVLVEREIMELPDGENFMPDEYLTPLEYFRILRSL